MAGAGASGRSPRVSGAGERASQPAAAEVISDVHRLLDRVDAALAGTEGDGWDTVVGEPVGVEPAVGMPALRHQSSRGRALDGVAPRRAPLVELERVVLEPARERHLRPRARGARPGVRWRLEGAAGGGG